MRPRHVFSGVLAVDRRPRVREMRFLEYRKTFLVLRAHERFRPGAFRGRVLAMPLSVFLPQPALTFCSPLVKFYLELKRFDRKDGSAIGEIGIIAQDLELLRPDLISINGFDQSLSIKNSTLRFHLFHAFQQLLERVEKLETP